MWRRRTNLAMQLSKGQKGLVIALAFAALILAFVFAWFMQTVEDVKTPLGPNERQAVPLGGDGPGVGVDTDSPGNAPEEDYDKIYEEEKKKQKGLGSLRK